MSTTENVMSTLVLLYAVFITAMYLEKRNELEEEVMVYEKLKLEMENVPQAKCISVKPYTYDQWVTTKPCPPGRRGPLCHMDESDYR